MGIVGGTAQRPTFPEASIPAAFDLLLHPRLAFETMRGQESLVPAFRFAATAMLMLGLSQAIVVAAGSTKLGLPPASFALVVVSLAIPPAVSPIFVLLIGALVHVLSTILGGSGTFQTSLRIAAYSFAPLMPGAVILAPVMLAVLGMPLAAIGYGIAFAVLVQSAIAVWHVFLFTRGLLVLHGASSTGVTVLLLLGSGVNLCGSLIAIPSAIGFQKAVHGYDDLQKKLTMTPAPAPTTTAVSVRGPTPTVTTDPMVEGKRKLASLAVTPLKKPDDLVPNVKKDLLVLRVPVREMKLAPASADGGWLISIDLVTSEKSDEAAMARSRYFALAAIGRYVKASGLAARAIVVRHVLDDGNVRTEETVTADIALAAAAEL